MPTDGRTKRNRNFVIGTVLSVAFVWMASRGVDPEAVWLAIEKSNQAWFGLFAAALFVFFIIKAWRWRLILSLDYRTGIRSVMPSLVLGYASNMVLPAQLGEVVRVFLAQKDLNKNLTTLAVSIFIEKTFDLLAIISLFVLLLFVDLRSPDTLILTAYILGGVGIVAITALVGSMLYADRLRQFGLKASRQLSAGMGRALLVHTDRTLNAIGTLANPSRVSAIALTSLLQWLVMGLCTLSSVMALKIEVPLSAAYVVMVATVIGLTLPSAPGFIGTIQLSFVLALTPFAVAHSEALAASIVFHAWMIASLVVASVFYIRRAGGSWTSIINQARDSAISGQP